MSSGSGRQGAGARVGAGAIVAIPAAGTVWLGFDAGGYFAGAPAALAALLAVALAVRATSAARPFAGLNAWTVGAATALGLLAVWQLASAAWSDAPGRALLEFDRTLLYLLGFVLLGSLPRTGNSLRWALRLAALGIAAVCLAGLATRTFPDVFPVAPNVLDERLSYPITYWNGLGVLAALGIVLALHLSSDLREGRVANALGAAAVPALAATLLLTFSRGGIAVAALGVVSYALLARPRGLLTALVATAPLGALAVALAYGADLLAEPGPTSAAAAAQGHDLALGILLCAAGAGVARVALSPVDSRLGKLRLPHAARRPLAAGTALVAFVAVTAAWTGLDAGDYIDRQYARFVEGDTLPDTGDVRDRLLLVGNNGRLDHWAVALEGFRSAPLEGTGAGTYELLWALERPSEFTVRDAHSLYLEVLAELGIVGVALLAAALLAILAGLASRLRGRERALHGAVLAVALVWAVHAGIDWDWELTAVSFPVLALAGHALASPRGEGPGRLGIGRGARLVVGAGALVLAVTPALVAYSSARLDVAVAAFKRGDCGTAIDAALDADAALPIRPEPLALVAWCDVRAGEPRLGVRMMERAVARDPRSWEYRYGLALVRGAAGLDPRGEAALALALNPLEPLARDAVRRFLSTDDPARWRARALGARLPIR